MVSIESFITETFVYKNYTALTEEESRKIWEGRNHPEIRKYMINPEPFPYEEHAAYIDRLKEKTDRLYYAVLWNGEVIASICFNPFDAENKEGEMGKYLIPEFMGKGVGFKMAYEFLDYMFKNNVVNRVYAKTLITNERNQHVNNKLGLFETHRDETYVYMETNGEQYRLRYEQNVNSSRTLC